MNIAFLGSGNVGAPLADHLQRLGHSVTLASNNPDSESLQKALARNPELKTADPQSAASRAEMVFLAVPFKAAAEALENLQDTLKGKILVDCTNPVGPGLSHGLNNTQSGSEFLQGLLPGTRVVKAFTVYGFENLENNHFPAYNIRPVMPICGHDAAAKANVCELADSLGWQSLDVGGLEQALHLEHMTLLWVRMVRLNGHQPNIVWAMLER